MKTNHLGLTLTDASETEMTFLEWRSKMNGTDGTSNMQLIDDAIAKLEESASLEIDYEAELTFDTSEIVILESGENAAQNN